MAFNPREHSHIRRNPLKDEWVLVSPHRMLRPWSGQVEKDADSTTFDSKNPLLPGATRNSGKVNPDYDGVYIFENDFPALMKNVPDVEVRNELLQSQAASGECHVMCYHPRSDVTLALMKEEEIRLVIDAWAKEFDTLMKTYQWVQIFENRGETMGCSNPHPHCQMWATSFLPNEVRIKDKNLKQYYDTHNSPLLVNYLKLERKEEERIVCHNDHWVVLVPYWAVWPFETMLLPKRQVIRLSDLSDEERNSLADILKTLLTKYDNLFQCSFPYSMGWHGGPGGRTEEENQHWTLHAMFYPPLLRSATIRKFMVGFELLAQAQRDLTPEQAAERLRSLSNKHYKEASKQN